MKKSRFSPEQIAKILKDYENGTSSEELCRSHGISRQTFYKWEKQIFRYGIQRFEAAETA